MWPTRISANSCAPASRDRLNSAPRRAPAHGELPPARWPSQPSQRDDERRRAADVEEGTSASRAEPAKGAGIDDAAGTRECSPPLGFSVGRAGADMPLRRAGASAVLAGRARSICTPVHWVGRAGPLHGIPGQFGGSQQRGQPERRQQGWNRQPAPRRARSGRQRAERRAGAGDEQHGPAPASG